MDKQLEQNFQKLAKNIIIRLQNDIIEGADYLKYHAFFKLGLEYQIFKNDLLISYIEGLINAQVENKSAEAIMPLKDEVCVIYTNLMSKKIR